jgi:glucose/arabinose dehydrogenase
MQRLRPRPLRGGLALTFAQTVAVALGFVIFTAPARAQLVRQAPSLPNLPAQLPSASGYVLENALGSLTFSQPLAIETPPGETGRLFVVEKAGRIQVVSFAGAQPTKSLFLDVRDIEGVGPGSTTNFLSDGESGLLGLAFHPAYASNHTFFITYSVRVNGNRHQRIARLRASASNPNLADPASHVPLITQLDEASNHNGGGIAFGPDGFLYVSTGDEGGSNDSWDNARWVDRDFFAAILRLDVDRVNVGQPGGSLEPNPHPSIDLDPATGRARYAIPPGNPLVVTSYAGTLGPLGTGAFGGGTLLASKIRTEFGYFGLRNAWRFSFDVPTGRLFIADVGQGAREEVNIAPLGANLGWPFFEGTALGPSSRQPAPANPPAPRLAPIHEYGRDVGTSITGGLLYRGPRLPELFAHYIFGDYVAGRVFALREEAGVWTRRTLIDGGAGAASFGIDPRNGDVLIPRLGNGVINRLARSGTSGQEPPATLSATGVFANLATLAPAPGIVPYDVNLPFWSDHARKSRWFGLPGTAATHAIGFSADAPWTFPTGTVWVKHFDLDAVRGDPATARRLETRLLVRTTEGVYGLSYRWRANQSEADLVPEGGVNATVPVTEGGVLRDQTWRFPGRGECLVCHTPTAGHALGFDTRQLKRPRIHGSVTDDQINHLVSAGYLAPAGAPSPQEVAALPAHAALDDASQSLEHRVRSYLAVNCVSCHSPGGAGLGDFDVRAHLGTAATRLRTGSLVNPAGDPANRLFAPADANRSMVLRRILGQGVPRMPPLASNELDPAAESLLRAYIAQLPSRPTFPEWQSTTLASVPPASAAPGADPDGDGASNRLEYLAGTPPLAPGPAPLAVSLGVSGGEWVLEFLHPADRSALIETSTDLSTWSRWVAPGNAPLWPANDLARQVRAPLAGERRFFRLRLDER